MPIKPENKARYPADWKLRSRFVRFVRAGNKCEWCGAKNHEPHPITGSRVVLTTAHVHDRRPESASLLNLAALCQRCHLNHDRPLSKSVAELKVPTNSPRATRYLRRTTQMKRDVKKINQLADRIEQCNDVDLHVHQPSMGLSFAMKSTSYDCGSPACLMGHFNAINNGPWICVFNTEILSFIL